MSETNDDAHMDMNTTFSSSYYKDVVKYNSIDLKEKMMLVERIHRTCKIKSSAKADEISDKSVIEKVHEYTGLPLQDIENIEANMSTADRSFQSAFSDISQRLCKRVNNDIRSIFIKYYTQNSEIPSTSSLFSELKEMAEEYKHEDLSLHKLIKNKSLKYLYLPAPYKIYLLMEHPQNVYERTVYLNTIQQYRSQGKNIVYVEIRYLKEANFPTFTIGLAAINRLEKFLMSKINHLGAKEWLKTNVVPHIPPDSVVVLIYPGFDPVELTPYSTKKELTNWLDENNIPHGKECHKAELYNLYKAFDGKIKAKDQNYDLIFEKANIEVLHSTGKWPRLNYFTSAWDKIYKIYYKYHSNLDLVLFKEKLTKAVTPFGLNLAAKEDKLKKEEQRFKDEDAQSENTMETFLDTINNEAIDLPGECCGNKSDFNDAYISNFLIS